MVRLNADLIRKSPRFINDSGEHVLDLKGNKITLIENLVDTEDQFDTIDLSHNEILKLENFSNLNRLGTLLLNINSIMIINPNIGEFLPQLHTLVLTNNLLDNFVEINPLASLLKLQYLSLLGNNITKKPNYRPYVIHKLKSLLSLDSKKIEQKERIEASKLFASEEAEKEAQKESVKWFVPVGPTPEEITAMKAAIVNSQTPEEAARLEKALKYCQVQAAILTRYINAMNNAMNKNATDGGKEDAQDGPTYMEQNSMEGDLVSDLSVNQPESERVQPRPLTKEEILSLNNHSMTFEYARSLFDVDLPTFKAKLLEFGILVWNKPHGLGVRIHGGDYKIRIAINKVHVFLVVYGASTFSVVKSKLEVDLKLTPGRYKLSYEKPEISVYEPLVTDLDWHEAVEYSKVRGYRLRLNVESDDVCFVLLKNAYDAETAIFNQHDDGETYDEYASDPSNMDASESDMAPYSSEFMIACFGD